MKSVKLSKRLQAVYDLIPKSGGAIDVGTDHGFIPIRLLQEGFSGKLYAADINEGPLESAKSLAARCGLSEKIEFRLTDGLFGIPEQDISTVVIAGMGGETIMGILSQAPWTRDSGRLMILQPMSHSDRLRLWLYQSGYMILSEQLVYDGRIYEIITARGGSEERAPSPAELLTGRIDLIGNDPLFPGRLQDLISKYSRALEGLSLSAEEEKQQKLPTLQGTLDSLLEVRAQLERRLYGQS